MSKDLNRGSILCLILSCKLGFIESSDNRPKRGAPYRSLAYFIPYASHFLLLSPALDICIIVKFLKLTLSFYKQGRLS
jgi:hypothetical protein